MKKWQKILIGILVLAAAGVASVFYMTSGMVDTADAFFNAVKQHDIAKARSYLAEDFKANTDEGALAAFLAKSAILNFKEASWSNRQIGGGRGELEGSIKTDAGGVVPIKISFVKENDLWKIFAIQKPPAGLQLEASSPTVPSRAEQVLLVKQSIRDFIVSVQNKNMEHFRSTAAQIFQKQYTAEQLTQAFKSLIDSGLNWPVLESLEPSILPEATVDEQGVLLLAGSYPTTPTVVNFEQRFIYEGASWKLVGFSILAK